MKTFLRMIAAGLWILVDLLLFGMSSAATATEVPSATQGLESRAHETNPAHQPSQSHGWHSPEAAPKEVQSASPESHDFDGAPPEPHGMHDSHSQPLKAGTSAKALP